MDDHFGYEKLSIRDSARSSKKYGSTSNRNSTKAETYIKHIVTSSDTLQGLALKYGVTMEQIRRANRLFATDSLFLREHLLIPVESTKSLQSDTNSESVDEPVTSPSNSQQSQLTSPGSCGSFYDEEEDVADFLVKMDARIASTKEDVKKIHKNSQYSGVEFANERRKPAVSRMKQMVNNNGISDILKTPQTVVMTQGNKIKTSMKRYQQQQDELFEL